jgi:hypothetical protein
MAAGTRASASAVTTNVEVVTGMTSKPSVFSGNHGDDLIIWEMKMTAHLMEKGLDKCLDPIFETRLPMKENGPFNMAVAIEEEKKFKEAVDLNKKAMCQFMQAFSTMNLLSKVNLQKKADNQFLSGQAWKLWMELQGDFNPDGSIAETELELALSKLKLTNKKNPQKLMEDIASCEVKYGVPISNGKKISQLIRLGRKKYSTVITVTQMCKKAKEFLSLQNTLWTKCRSNGASKVEKKKARKRMKKKPLLQKLMTKQKRKLKVVEKQRMEKARRKRLGCVIIAESRDTSRKCVGRKILHKCLRNCKRRKKKRQERQLKKSIFYQTLMYVTTSVSSVLTLKLLMLMYLFQSHLLKMDSEM